MCRARTGVLIFTGILGLAAAAVFGYWAVTGSQTFPGLGILFLVLKFGPFFAMMVFLVRTVNPTAFIRALAHMKVPATLLVPLGVTLRFMPAFAREFGHIRDAMAFRGVGLTPRSLVLRPFRAMEYLLVPLLMRCLIMGEELSRAGLARGITAPGRNSCFEVTRFRRRDWVWSGLWTLGTLVVVVVADYRGGL